MDEILLISAAQLAPEQINKSRRLLNLWPQIQVFLDGGVRHQAILDRLNELGFDLNMSSYKTMIHRIRKRAEKPPQFGTRVADPRRPVDGFGALIGERPKKFEHDISKLSDW